MVESKHTSTTQAILD
jgi:acyl-CoA oxidase